MFRRLEFLLVCAIAAASAACSHRSSDRASTANPIAPTSQVSNLPSETVTSRPTAVVIPLAVDFPPRNDAFDFRNQLEVKYRDGLRRQASSSFVDIEGDIVWTQEYIRYRVNDCDHATAVLKVFSQIDGSGVAATCGPGSSVISFPPRNQPLDFRLQLEARYRDGLRRPATSTFVDLEGDIVWTQEYLRYRVSSCNHATSVQKVFAQVDGGGIQADCTPPPPSCVYTVSPASQSVASGGGSFSATLARTSGSCSWSASSSASFITITGAASGADPATIAYTVAANTGTSSRTGTITISWSTGSTQITVTQSGAPPATVFGAFRLFDFARQPSATTECQFRSLTSTTTTCTLDGSTSFTSGRETIVSYAWTVRYTYVDPVTLTQTGSSPIFTFSDKCGKVTSTDTGAVQPLAVTLTVTDSAGNTATVSSGSGSQPALSVRLFTCGS